MTAAPVTCTCPTCGAPYTAERPRVDLGANLFLCAAGSVRVTPTQAEILAVLLERFPQTVSIDHILTRIYNWVGEPDGAEQTLRVQIYRLKQSLAPLGWGIIASWTRGYRLERIEG